jgi:hypothetical protein
VPRNACRNDMPAMHDGRWRGNNNDFHIKRERPGRRTGWAAVVLNERYFSMFARDASTCRRPSDFCPARPGTKGDKVGRGGGGKGQGGEEEGQASTATETGALSRPAIMPGIAASSRIET